MNPVNKAAVSVSEMARMLSMSRARFYQLMNEGVFPKPQYEPSNNRPYFDAEAQEMCLEVRRRNCGINGRPVMFYPARSSAPTAAKRSPKRKPKPNNQYAELINALASLGLSVSGQQVNAAIRECFPNGLSDTDEGSGIRTLFLHLKRQN